MDGVFPLALRLENGYSAKQEEEASPASRMRGGSACEAVDS
jgi:hypothetical protein